MPHNLTIGQVLRSTRIPGSDIKRTIVSGVFAFAVLVLTREGMFPYEPACKAIQPLQQVSLVLLLASLLLAGLSISAALTVKNLHVRRIQNYWIVYKGKLLLDIAILLFFCVVCLWVVGLGGVTRSPFSAILCLSPALILIPWFTDRRRWYDDVYSAIVAHNKKLADANTHRWVRRTMRILGVAPLIVVLLTLVFGQMAVAKLSAHQWFLAGDLEPVLSTAWYYSVYYALYYLSAAIAIFGMTFFNVPVPHFLQRLVARFRSC